jgi:DNA-binding NtrC family response regulator
LHRILVVEDEEPVARALERWLRRQGCEVRVLLDVQLLAEVLREFNPTMVVSDLHMPLQSGLEVLAEVKRLAPAAGRALLSGSLRSVSIAELQSIQPVRLVAKPWNNATLLRDLGLEPA